MTMKRWRRACAALVAGSSLLAAGNAFADRTSDARKLIRYQGEVTEIGRSIQRTQNLQKRATRGDRATTHLIEAQVQFGIKNYDAAAIMLYEFVDRYKNHREHDQALYLLAESLFQKGDNMAARTYFKKLLSEYQSGSKYYVQGLERLIELSIRLQDPDEVDAWLQFLDQLPANKRVSSAQYVRGKYAFYEGKYDVAAGWFRKVAERSKYDFQAQFFLGAALVSKKDLAAAINVYVTITRKTPKSEDDRRIVELAQMALGRIHYELDQPSKAIDNYLEISRRSDLFDEVLYEVAWVYVKNKQFPKALRALELLELTDPRTSRTPEVKLLEANLRLRRAQALTESGGVTGETEYLKALTLFETTRDDYAQPAVQLAKLIEDHESTARFFTQIMEREESTFQTEGALSEVSAAWTREDPEVQRIIGVEKDLGQIRREIEQTTRTLERLERAVNSTAKVDVYPSLAAKYYRSVEITDDVERIRALLLIDLDKLARKVATPATVRELNKLATQRGQLRRDLQIDLDDGRQTRRSLAEQRHTQLEHAASQIHVTIEKSRAEIVGIEQYLNTAPEQVEGESEIRIKLGQLRGEVQILEADMQQLQADALLARDTALSGIDAGEDDRRLRTKYTAALMAHEQLLKSLVPRMPGRDGTKAKSWLGSLRSTQTIMENCADTRKRIESIVDNELTDVKRAISEEQAQLAVYRTEFEEYLAESESVGGSMIDTALAGVAKKLRNVMIRADVGMVDVAWSRKEDNERSRRRLVLDQSRERRVLDTDFADVINEFRRQRMSAASQGDGSNE